ncbi:MAG: hypothetical protein EAZ97_07495 [Bacteroidetes bacterium]|nr:MAG: hypothetical protein EAZ97_07495 [Bacteroidota bacterium]
MEYINFYSNKYADISFHQANKIALLNCKVNFIPEKEFQLLFGKMTELVKKYPIYKFIFDKRALTIFHQPSMEWYHLVWKKEMLAYGLKCHRKILPADLIFRKSVEIGKAKILKENPDNILHLLDIQYFESVEEAENS